ncbi:hypothetical protein [Asticcacaulis sp. 201]|uniref:hypothetical protein n=1 Tax=Asticcacaulis sp. 201 TaxID=3028787 RepID=UPI0029162F9C|nr:hypothetical protein [Asticcacaulis sp. 201]MDV6329908.1 hypothetical protein [Asticcacaulis sp. 201]
MKTALACVALALLSAPAWADDASGEPAVDRAAALNLGPKLTGEIEAALSRPLTDLYRAAEGGAVHDKWIYALALSADRHTLDPLPANQRDLYLNYSQRVDTARTAYQKKHKKADTSTMPMDAFVTPTDQEVFAVRLVDHINNPAVWLTPVRAAPADVAPEVLTQSLRCIEIVKSRVEGDDMMEQLLGAALTTGDKGDATSAKDFTSLTAALKGTEKSDIDLDDEALCGGTEAYERDRALMKAIYTPKFHITVSKKK